MNTGDSTALQLGQELRMPSHRQAASQLIQDLHYFSQHCHGLRCVLSHSGAWLVGNVTALQEVTELTPLSTKQKSFCFLKHFWIWPTVSKRSKETSKHNSKNKLCTRYSWKDWGMKSTQHYLQVLPKISKVFTTAAADGSHMMEAEHTAKKWSQNVYPKMLLLAIW